jgi:hypothetical protein
MRDFMTKGYLIKGDHMTHEWCLGQEDGASKYGAPPEEESGVRFIPFFRVTCAVESSFLKRFKVSIHQLF